MEIINPEYFFIYSIFSSSVFIYLLIVPIDIYKKIVSQYFKEKERRELVVRNKKICFEEKEMEGFTFQNVDRDSSAIRIAEEYVANWQKMKQNQRRRAMRRLFLYNEWRGLNCYIFIIRYQIKIGKEIKIGYNKYKKVDWWSK